MKRIAAVVFHRSLGTSYGENLVTEARRAATLDLIGKIHRAGLNRVFLITGAAEAVLFEEREPETFDRVVYAIGGTTLSAFLTGSGIAIENGTPVHDDHYETNVPGIFVAGDITQERGGSIALGLNHGYYIAKHILDHDTMLRRDDDVVTRLD